MPHMSPASNEAMDMYVFIALFVSNFITSCLFLHYAYEVHAEVTKSGKNSALTKKKEKTLHTVILIQFIINLVFNVITQYRTHMKNVLLSIIWGLVPLFYYLLALTWEKVKIHSIGGNIFLWTGMFLVLNTFAFFAIIHHENFGYHQHQYKKF